MKKILLLKSILFGRIIDFIYYLLWGRFCSTLWYYYLFLHNRYLKHTLCFIKRDYDIS